MRASDVLRHLNQQVVSGPDCDPINASSRYNDGQRWVAANRGGGVEHFPLCLRGQPFVALQIQMLAQIGAQLEILL